MSSGNTFRIAVHFLPAEDSTIKIVRGIISRRAGINDGCLCCLQGSLFPEVPETFPDRTFPEGGAEAA